MYGHQKIVNIHKELSTKTKMLYIKRLSGKRINVFNTSLLNDRMRELITSMCSEIATELEELARNSEQPRGNTSMATRGWMSIGDLADELVSLAGSAINYTIVTTLVVIPSHVEYLYLKTINPYDYTDEEMLFEVVIPSMKRQINGLKITLTTLTTSYMIQDGISEVINSIPGSGIEIIPIPRRLTTAMRDIMVSEEVAN